MAQSGAGGISGGWAAGQPSRVSTAFPGLPLPTSDIHNLVPLMGRIVSLSSSFVEVLTPSASENRVFKKVIMEKKKLWLVCPIWLECCPVHQEVVGSTPGHGTYPGCGAMPC